MTGYARPAHRYATARKPPHDAQTGGAHNGRGRGSNVTVVVLFALFVVAVVTVPVAWTLAWTLSVALELLRRARRLEVRVAGLNDAVSDLTHLLTDER